MQKDVCSEKELAKDKCYVIKKLDLTEDEFEKLMNLPVKSHFDYESDVKWRPLLKFIYRILNTTRLTKLLRLG